MKKAHTVIGLYADNQQPWIEHVSSENPRQAAIDAITKLSVEYDCDDMYVVEVLEGTHMGTLLNDTVLHRKALEEGLSRI